MVINVANQRKSNTKAPVRSSKGSTTKGKTTGRTTKKQSEQVNQYNPFSLTAFFAAGLLCLALVMIKGDSLWEFLHNVFYGLFGMCAIVIPLTMLVSTWFIAYSRQGRYFGFKVTSVFISVLLICGILQVVNPSGYSNSGFFELLSRLYVDGTQLNGGGVASVLIGYWVHLLTGGKAQTIIVLSLFLFLLVSLVTGITLAQIFSAMGKPFKKGYTAVKQATSHRANVVRARPVVSEELPAHPVSSLKQEDDIIALLNAASQSGNGPVTSINPALENAAKSRVFKPAKKPAIFQMPKQADTSVSEGKKDEVKEADPLNHLVDKVVKSDATPPFDPKTGEVIGNTALLNAMAQLNGGVSDVSGDKVLDIEPQEKPQADNLIDIATAIESSKLYMDGNNQTLEYHFPPVTLLKQYTPKSNEDVSKELKANAELLVKTLNDFNVSTKIVDIARGPTVTRYELQPAAGVKISKITGLSDDIALNLATAGVRIEAPIPNKAAIGIEVPNKVTDIVSAREIIDSEEFRSAEGNLTVALGKNIAGQIIVADLAKMPHTLIAGSTGSGKSVCINSLISSIIFKSSPSDVRMILIDPKVVELGIYNGIPHLLVPVVTDPKKASGALAWAVQEMLKRYNAFAENSVRDIKGYNRVAKGREDLAPMPHIVIIIDELADLMMAAPNEVEDSICRLAQMARAAGMHLVIATQRPSVDVITGVIKANIPSRIAFAVSSQIDSRTILDGAGAEKLLGRGDMLFYPSGMPKPLRVQGCWISDSEVEEVVKFVSGQSSEDYDQEIIAEIERNAAASESADDKSGGDSSDYSDDLFPAAVECVLDAGQASTSYLQRKIKVGYARAARLIDELEEKHIIGPFDGSKPRPVLITRAQWAAMNSPVSSQTTETTPEIAKALDKEGQALPPDQGEQQSNLSADDIMTAVESDITDKESVTL